MKVLSKGLVLISALGISSSTFANCFDCFEFLVGLDYYQAWRKTKENHHIIIPKSFPGGTLYVGGRWEYLGFELGYDSSIRLKKNWTVPAGTTIGNFRAPIQVSGTTKARFRGVHFDLLSYLPMDCNKRLELFGALGFGTAGLRVGAGANYMLTDCFGVRLKVGYENNSYVRVTYATPYTNVGLNRRPFTHAGTLSAGVFAKF